MDLNGQNSISILLQKLKKISELILIVFLFLGLGNNAYANINTKKIDDKDLVLVGNSKSNKKVKDLASNEDNYINMNATKVFNSNVSNRLSINLQGHSIKLLDNTVSLFFLMQDKYSLLEEICSSYINELGLNVDNITQIQVLGTINPNLEKNRITSLNYTGELAQEVYTASVINESFSDLEFKITLTETESVEPETIVEECNELYMGETETITGVKGISLVNKEITYNGLNISEEKIVSESIIKPAVNNIVKVGKKNPYCDGIAFLSRPTKGGYLSSYFGEVRVNKLHKGIDIAENLGENVNASFDGKVIRAGYNNGGYGNLIVIEHDNNMKTYYAHLKDINVNVGDLVKKDDIIGTIGSTGNSTGPHLHFELRVNDTPVDPIKYIKQ